MRTTVVIAPPAAAGEWVRFMRRAAEMVRFGWRAYWRWRFRQTTLRLLRSLDERLLGDPGADPLSLQSLLAKSEPQTNPLPTR